MTTCAFCLDEMAARSNRQLARRTAKIAAHPEVRIAPCPHCGGTEWALTDYMVEPDPPPRFMIWLRDKLWRKFPRRRI